MINKAASRYSAKERQHVVTPGAKEGLAGEKASQRCGIAMLMCYRWRGPERGRTGRIDPRALNQQNVVTRRQVQAEIRRMLPRIIREEVGASLGIVRGAPSRSRAV